MSKLEDERSRIKNKLYSILETACNEGRWHSVGGSSMMGPTLYPTNDYEYGIEIRLVGDEQRVQNTIRPSSRARVTFKCTKAGHRIRTYLSVPWKGPVSEGGWALDEKLFLSKLSKASLRLLHWRQEQLNREDALLTFENKVDKDFRHLGILDTYYSEDNWAQVAEIDADWGYLTLHSYNCGETYNLVGIHVDQDLSGARLRKVLDVLQTQLQFTFMKDDEPEESI